MKRDMDLARRILLEVEADPKTTGFGYRRVDIEGHDQAEVSYHIRLLSDAGLLEAKSLSTTAGLDWRVIRLTYAGHEFLEASRKDTLWQKAKSTVLEKTGGLSFEVLKAVLLKLATDAVTGGGE